MPDWLLLLYKVPPEPSAGRVYVWRQLKRLSAILLHDAVWVLPANPRNREHFQWLTSEIEERGGEAHVWEAASQGPRQSEALRQKFLLQSETAYRALLDEIESSDGDADWSALSRRFQRAQEQDYFNCGLGRRVRSALLAARGGGPA